MSYEIDTVVRRPVSRARLAAAVLPTLAAFFFLPRTAVLVIAVFAVGILAVEGIATLSSRRARVLASREGLRVGSRFVPRDAFVGALVSHDDGRTYVALRGRVDFDVQVPNNIDADALVHALGLDAASSTVEVRLTTGLVRREWVGIAAAFVGTSIAFFAAPSAFGKLLAAALGLLFVVAMAWLASRVTLRIGADGLVVRRPLHVDRFIAHDGIAHVATDDDAIVLSLASGERIVLRVNGLRSSEDDFERQRAHDERRADEAQAVVRRIQQAQRAYHEHAAAADALAAVLARGERSGHEWLDQLRRVGEGASSAFRTMGVARSRLFDIVESTTASAHDRIAAAIALRSRIGEDEKPRVRVAAERCAEPELRERLIRILEAEDEKELELLIDEKWDSHR